MEIDKMATRRHAVRYKDFRGQPMDLASAWATRGHEIGELRRQLNDQIKANEDLLLKVSILESNWWTTLRILRRAVEKMGRQGRSNTLAPKEPRKHVELPRRPKYLAEKAEKLKIGLPGKETAKAHRPLRGRQRPQERP